MAHILCRAVDERLVHLQSVTDEAGGDDKVFMSIYRSPVRVYAIHAEPSLAGRERLWLADAGHTGMQE